MHSVIIYNVSLLVNLVLDAHLGNQTRCITSCCLQNAIVLFVYIYETKEVGLINMEVMVTDVVTTNFPRPAMFKMTFHG